MANISLRGIRKTYPGTPSPAVDGFDLDISRGEILTLLGPSGCGKTTTLRLVAGFESPDRGAVLFDGRDMVGVPPEKRNIGMVFQDYALFPHLTVEQNIGFGLKRAGGRGRKVRRMVELVGLQGHEKKRPDQVSGGQQGRAALARALARDPAVVLLDEPFSSLDADLRGKMQQEVTSIIKKAGATAVFVTHDQKEAMLVSDRIAVMRNGRLEQVGTPRDVYQRPETIFVSTFVGQSNILKGRMGEDGRSIETSFGRIPCSHTHGSPPGEEVVFCIRPCGFERDETGPIRGRVVKTAYTGDNTDAVLKVQVPDGAEKEFLVHLHPEDILKDGADASFRVLPYFVAVVADRKPQ